jgi:hypothetical protein
MDKKYLDFLKSETKRLRDLRRNPVNEYSPGEFSDQEEPDYDPEQVEKNWQLTPEGRALSAKLKARIAKVAKKPKSSGATQSRTFSK